MKPEVTQISNNYYDISYKWILLEHNVCFVDLKYIFVVSMD